MRLLSLLGLCILLGIVAVAAPAAPNRLLPSSAGAWTSPAVQQVRPEALESIAGDDAAILREYGILGAERAIYAGNGRQLTVSLYRMHDSSAAYGAYTLLRTADMAASNIAEKSAVGRDRVLAVEGNLLLDIATPGTASLSDLKALIAKVASAAERAPYPALREYLPAQGLVVNSDHYLLGSAALERQVRLTAGPASASVTSDTFAATLPIALHGTDWLGFSDGAEAELARYRIRGELVPLILVRYPTRQLATKHLDALGRVFFINPPSGAATDSSDSRPVIFVVRKGSLIAIVGGTRSPALASELFGGVQYETNLTWSEPTWRVTEKPFVQLLYEVFVGTGVIIVYAAVASLAFGFVRLVIKRRFPNRVFDRPGQIEVLQLGIYSKPIESKDFYSEEPPV